MIVFHIDIMLARRKMSLTELSERVGITIANLSILKTGKARADDISGLVVHALGLLGMGKGFIGSSRIIHILCSSFFVGQPRTFYTGAAFCFSLWPYCTQSNPFSQ